MNSIIDNQNELRPMGMTREQYLLQCLSEECNEVAQRASKAIRFGLEEVQPGQEKSNAARMIDEINDLFAVLGMVMIECKEVEKEFEHYMSAEALEAKRDKVELYYKYSKEARFTVE